MDLKKGVGIDYCYKSKETGEKDTLGSIAVKSKETRRKVSTCQHGPIYLANAQLPSQLGTIQISVKSIAFYPYFGFYSPFISCQSRDKMLQILLRFVLYPTMMVAIALARQIGQCWQVHAFHLVSLLLQQWSIPTYLFKFIIFKLFFYVYFLWFSYSYSQLLSENICSTELHCYSMRRNCLLI